MKQTEPEYNLLPWIQINKLSSRMLSKNPNAVSYLEKNPTKIDWHYLSSNTNPNAIDMIKKNKQENICWWDLCKNPKAVYLIEEQLDKLYLLQKKIHPIYLDWDWMNWENLFQNPNAIHIIEKHLDDFDETYGDDCMLFYLSNNPNAIHIIEKNLDKLDFDCWRLLSKNPNALNLLEKNQDKINWSYLSQNPNALDLLEKNQDKIDWRELSGNPNALYLLEKNLDKVDWSYLSKNPNALELLEKNQDKINWHEFSANPSIFEMDYTTIKKQMFNSYFEELMMVSLHPIRISAWLDAGFEDF